MRRVFDSGTNIRNRLGPEKLREMILRRNQLQKDFLDRWQATQEGAERPLDGVICAASPTAANRLGLAEKVQYIGYTCFQNLLGMTCPTPNTHL
jgi:amidase